MRPQNNLLQQQMMAGNMHGYNRMMPNQQFNNLQKNAMNNNAQRNMSAHAPSLPRTVSTLTLEQDPADGTRHATHGPTADAARRIRS